MTTSGPIGRRQKFLSLSVRLEAAQFAIARFVFCRARRVDSDELIAFLCDKVRQIFTVEWRHVSRPAMRALVVAHAGPFVGPDTFASSASIEVKKPSHAKLLRSQTIIPSRNEINKSAITQIL